MIALSAPSEDAGLPLHLSHEILSFLGKARCPTALLPVGCGTAASVQGYVNHIQWHSAQRWTNALFCSLQPETMKGLSSSLQGCLSMVWRQF